MLFLGSIKSISLHEAIVSLPQCLTGFIKISELCKFAIKNSAKSPQLILKQLESLFLDKTLLFSVSFLKERPTTKVYLSVCPQKTNSRLKPLYLGKDTPVFGCIDSREEKGCLADINLAEEEMAFLRLSAEKAKKLTAILIKKDSDAFGQNTSLKTILESFVLPIWCRIKKMKMGKPILSLIKKPFLQKNAAEFEAIQPGALVQCTVQDIFANGLKVLFLGIFYGMIDLFGLDRAVSGYAVGDKFLARIVFVDYSTKKVFLSNKAHLLESLNGKSFIKRAEQILSLGNDQGYEAKVVEKDQKGFFLKLNADSGEIDAFCHPTQKAAKNNSTPNYKKGAIQKFRIFGQNAISGVLQAAPYSSKQALQGPLRAEDLKIGEFLEGKLLRFEHYGLVLSISRGNYEEDTGLKGVIANNQIADFPPKNPKLKFDIGEKIKCRVLNFDLVTRRVFLTAKKTLLGEKLPVIASLDPNCVNEISYGCVNSVNDYGLFLNFFGDVYGFLHAGKIRRAGFSEDIKKIYSLGQLLQVRIEAIDPQKRKLILALDLHAKSAPKWVWPSQNGLKLTDAEKVVSPGDCVNATVFRLTADRVSLFVQVASEASEKPLLTGQLNLAQKARKSAEETFAAGKLIEKLTVLHFTQKKEVILSDATEIRLAVRLGLIPRKFEELEKRKLYVGTVRKVSKLGVLVGFLGDCTCFCPFGGMRSSEGSGLERGDAVFVEVRKVDSEKRRAAGVVCAEQFSKECFSSILPKFGAELLDPFLGNDPTFAQWQCFDAVPENVRGEDEVCAIKLKSANEDQLKFDCVLLKGKKDPPLEEGMPIRVTFVASGDDSSSPKKAYFTLSQTRKPANSPNQTGSAHIFDVYSLRSDLLLLFSKEKSLPAFAFRRLLNANFGPSNTLPAASKGTIAAQDKTGRLLVSLPQNCQKVPSTPSKSLEAIVTKISPNGLIVLQGGTAGFVHFSELSDSLSTLRAFSEESLPKEAIPFPIGSKVSVVSLGDHMGKTLFSVKRAKSQQPTKTAEGAVGLVRGVIGSVWLSVEVAFNRFGRVHITSAIKASENAPFSKYRKGDFLRVYSAADFYARLSAPQPEELYSLTPPEEMAKQSQKLLDLKQGDVVYGYVKNFSEAHGLFITLSPSTDCLVYKSDISDTFVEDIEKEFAPGTRVKGKIVSVSFGGGKKFRLSLKASDLDSTSRKFEDFEEKQLVEGIVTSVNDIGIFVKLCGSCLTALCRIFYVENKQKLEKEELIEFYKRKRGQKLGFYILKINRKEQKISLSMDRNSVAGNRRKREFVGNLKGETAEGELPKSAKTAEGGEGCEEIKEEHSETESADENDRFFKKDVVSLDQIVKPGEESEGEMGEKESPIKTETDDSSQKRDQKEQLENLRKEVEKSPRNALEWIKLMRFLSASSRVKEARKTGGEALEQIPLEAESDRFAIWAELVAIEVDFGTSSSFESCLNEALQHFSKVKFLGRVIESVVAKRKLVTANTLFSRLLSIEKKDVSIWLAYGRFLLKHSPDLPPNCVFKKYPLLKEPNLGLAREGANADSLRRENKKALLSRALQLLDKRSRFTLLLRFAKAEFAAGSKQAARQTLEDVIASFPRSAKAWEARLDVETGQARTKENTTLCRELFERAVKADLPLRDAKSVFSRFLDFARKAGNEGEVEAVKQKAKEYVNRLNKKSE